MARGGFRPGSGRPKGSARPPAVARDIRRAAAASGVSPLDYMLAVMRDPGVDETRRDRMAMAAAPFVHGKAAEQGKKAERQENAEKAAEGGRFGVPTSPKLAVDNT